MFDTVKRDVAFDYPAQGFGTQMASLVNSYKSSTTDNHYLWRYYAILTQVGSSTER